MLLNLSISVSITENQDEMILVVSALIHGQKFFCEMFCVFVACVWGPSVMKSRKMT